MAVEKRRERRKEEDVQIVIRPLTQPWRLWPRDICVTRGARRARSSYSHHASSVGSLRFAALLGMFGTARPSLGLGICRDTSHLGSNVAAAYCETRKA